MDDNSANNNASSAADNKMNNEGKAGSGDSDKRNNSGNAVNASDAPMSSEKSAVAVTPVAEKVKDQAQQVVAVTRQTAGDLVGQVQSQVTSRLTDQKNAASDTLKQVADVVRNAGQGLNDQQQATLGQYADTAANAVADLAEYVRGRDVQEFAGDMEAFARQRPALFIGGAFALGLLAGRFLRSSSRAAEGRMSLPNYDPLTPAPRTYSGVASSY